jgi:Uma2 family endonuclease
MTSLPPSHPPLPSPSRRDELKRLRYREAGIPLDWLVDGEERSVEVWTPADDFPTVERERLVGQAPGARMPFTLALEELFRPV